MPQLSPPSPDELGGSDDEQAAGELGHGEGIGTGSGFGRGTGRMGSGGLARATAARDPVTVDPQLAVGSGAAPGPEPEPEGPMALVERVIGRLGEANIVFSPPVRMRVNEKRVVELLLSMQQSIEKLSRELMDATNAQAASGVKVSPRMEATLTGTGFEIQSLTPTEQVVSPSGTTRWSWELSPTKAGKQLLHLSLSARVEVEGRDAPFVVRTFDRAIEVEITPTQIAKGFVQEHWQWLWALLVPPAFEVWRRWRKKRKRKAKALTPAT